MTLAAVLFDLDGTLVDTLPICYLAFRGALEGAGAPTMTERRHPCLVRTERGRDAAARAAERLGACAAGVLRRVPATASLVSRGRPRGQRRARVAPRAPHLDGARHRQITGDGDHVRPALRSRRRVRRHRVRLTAGG